jgi:prophage maintenance system killer protein
MELDADEAEAVGIILDLARGEVTEDSLAKWVRSRITDTESGAPQ